MKLRARFSILVSATLIVALAGCSRQDERLRQHRKHFESLGATTAAIGEAWLGGSVSGTYTLTALDQTFRLVEQEQTALASTPNTLIDPRGAELSQAAEKLLRLLARLTEDVRSGDAGALRGHLAEMPIKPSESH